MSEEKEKGRLSLKLGRKKLLQQTLPSSKVRQNSTMEAESQSECPPPFSGLHNLGNTCYLNSILQVLRFCPGFRSGVEELISNWEEGSESKCSSSGGSLIAHLCKLWQRMVAVEEEGRAPLVVDPTEFMTKLKEEYPIFAGHMQQDAQEVLRCLLTSIQDTYTFTTRSQSSMFSGVINKVADMPVLPRKKRKLVHDVISRTCKKLTDYYRPFTSADHTHQSVASSDSIMHFSSGTVSQCRKWDVIVETFQGMLVFQTRCFECDSCVSRSEAFLDISVPVDSSVLPGFPTCSSPERVVGCSPAVGPFSLSWALSQFARREHLHGENKYWCDLCGHLVEAERSVLFASLPPVVTIHLNRFTTQACGLFSTVNVRKVGGNLAVPATFCFNPWCLDTCTNKDRVYHLFAVVFHCGSSCHSGHYTTCVRAQECLAMQTQLKFKSDGTWFYFDDDGVECVAQCELLEMLSPLSTGSHTAYILFYRTTQ